MDQTGTLEYNLLNFSSSLITSFSTPQYMWFSLFYDTAVIAPPNQEGFNGKIFSVYSNGAVAPTTWDLTTSFAGAAPSGVSTQALAPTGAASITTSSSAVSRTSSSTIQTSSPTGTSTTHSTGGEGVSRSGVIAIVVVFSIAVAFLIGTVFWLVRRLKNLPNVEKGPSSTQNGFVTVVEKSEIDWKSQTDAKSEIDWKSETNLNSFHRKSETNGISEIDRKSGSTATTRTMSTWI
jgi:hypothetical protein